MSPIRRCRSTSASATWKPPILARTGIVLLLPLRLHMGKIYGFVPLLDGMGVWWMWLFFAVWLVMTWTAFIKRETDIGIAVTRTEEWLRYPLIAALLIVSFLALGGSGPIETNVGNYWYPAKMALYAFALCIGLFLRIVMRRWTSRFRILAAGPDPVQEAALQTEIALARYCAYIYWITIASVCFLGAVKPF